MKDKMHEQLMRLLRYMEKRYPNSDFKEKDFYELMVIKNKLETQDQRSS